MMATYYKGRTGKCQIDTSEWAIYSGSKRQEFAHYNNYASMLNKSNEEPQDLCIRAPPTNNLRLNEGYRSENLERRTTSSSSSSVSSAVYKPAYVSQTLKMPIKQEPMLDNVNGEGFLPPTRLQFQQTMDSVEYGESCGSAASRKERAFVPDSRKDDSYWVKRRKNNDAAKRSREKRRAVDSMLENKVLALNEENSRLKLELELFKEQDRVVESTKPHLNGATTTSPPAAHHRHVMPTDTLGVHAIDRNTLSYDFMDRNRPMAQSSNRMYPYAMSSMRSDVVMYQSERFIPQFIRNDKEVYYPASSSKGTMQFETTPSHYSFLPSLQSGARTSSNGHYDSYEPATKKTKIGIEENDQSVKTNVHGDADENNSDDASKSDVGDGNSDHRSSHSPGRLSPTHSAFASGIDAKRLPHKLRAKLGAVSPTQNNTLNSPTLASPELQDDSAPLSRVNLEMFNADDGAVCSDLRNVRLGIGGICTPPSSTTSEEAQIGDSDKHHLTTKTSQTVEKKSDTHSFEIKQEPLDWKENVDVAFASAQATRLSRERMLKAAQALTEMEASDARTSQKDDQSSQMSTNDAKYWEKRRRNNLAARKCRESKRLLHEYRCARASYLEHENNQLHSEIDMLTKDVASLKEMLKAKQQLRVA